MSNSLAMSKWAEPKHAGEWALRLFSPLSACILLLLLTLFITELRFDWAEQLLGRYLVTTNGARPESGAIWEVGRQTRTARKTLDQIVTDRQSVQNEARGADSLSALAAGIQPGQWVMLTPGHFRKLYLKLPPSAAREMIAPRTLLALDAGGLWDRAYCERAGEGLTVYLLDSGNRVLRQLTVGAELLAPQLTAEAAGALEERPAFRGRIHPAKRFFDTLSLLGPEVGEAILPRPELLLGQEGRIGRVGISGEVARGFVSVGFEIAVGARRRVVVLKGRDWAVFQLQAALTGDRIPGDPAAEEGGSQGNATGAGETDGPIGGDGVSAIALNPDETGADGAADGDGARVEGDVILESDAPDDLPGTGDISAEATGGDTLPDGTTGVAPLSYETTGVAPLSDETTGVDTFPDETGGVAPLSDETTGGDPLSDEIAGLDALPDETVGVDINPDETAEAGTPSNETVGVADLPGGAGDDGGHAGDVAGERGFPVDISGAGDGSGTVEGGPDASGRGPGVVRGISEEDIPGDATGWVGMPAEREEP